MEFSIFRFPVKVNVSFLFLAGILGLNLGMNMMLVYWIGIAFVSILVHEFGHALAMRAYGYTPSIELHGFGGVCYWGELENEIPPLHRGVVSFMGPFAGFLVGSVILGITWVVKPEAGTLGADLVYLSLFSTIGWSILNLIPMFPLDGGNILLSVYNVIFKTRKNTPVYLLSMGIAVIAGLAALVHHMPITAFFAALCAMSSYQAMQDEKSGEGEPLSKEIEALWDLEDEGEPEAVIRAAKKLLPTSKSAREQEALITVICWNYVHLDKMKKAREWFEKFPESTTPGPLLNGVILLHEGELEKARVLLEEGYLEDPEWTTLFLAECYIRLGDVGRGVETILESGSYLDDGDLDEIVDILFKERHYRFALKLSKFAYHLFENPDDAYNTACALALMNNHKPALKWLKRALAAGYDPHYAQKDQDFASLSAVPEFKEIVNTYLK